MTRSLVAALALCVASVVSAQTDWREGEKGILSDSVQITSRADFLKAGEAYFDPTTSWVIFQAIPVPAEGAEAGAFYDMYVAKLTKNGAGDITGIEAPIMVSNPGSYNTCGFFHPTEPGKIIFGSSIDEPRDEKSSGYQRGTSQYRWAFPSQTEVVTCFVKEIVEDLAPEALDKLGAGDFELRPLFERPGGYDAECSFSPDGRHIVFASVDPDTGDADLFVHDTKTGETIPVIEEEGYDGGPFFSPDGKKLCYRSDRVGNDLLQIFTADLEFDASGAVTGIGAEHQHTDNEHVNWAPFFHPSGEFMVYATSAVSHRNYEVFAISTDPENRSAPKRITYAEGFDGLPVFSNDGAWMMWTSQRGGTVEGEERASSQLWVARVGAGMGAE